MLGADTELDRQVLDLIKDPLTHMVRNSADHGLETPAERRALGKPEKGAIRLSARHEGGHIVIEIADDGRGLNAERIRAKALAAGLASEAELDKMTEAQILRFIFAPGLSTAEQITSVSGRGVGMDVVKNNIDQIGGTIDVKSAAGAGCLFTIKIPLTLAIVSALIVEAAGDRFAIPQLAVMELVRIQANSEHRIERIKDTPVLRLRDKLLPLVHLAALLELGSDAAVDDDGGFIVVVQVGSQRFGVVVDGVFHTEEIVVKPMSTRLRHIGMFSGNTILGDGAVIMIVDPNGIAEAVGAIASDMRETAEVTSAEADRGQTVSLLVFRAGSQELKAAPLSLVTRLEEIDCKSIEQSNGRSVVQYRGRLMPLLCMGEACRIRRDGVQQVLVFSEAERVMGLAVDEIVDIVEDRLSIEIASRTPGVLGSAIVKGKATEILDVGHFLPLAFDDWSERAFRRHGATAVLLVDDSAFFRNMLQPVLQAAGCEVVTAASAEEALAALARKSFEAVISDIDMPGMSGLDFARALRADQPTAAIPLIALASHAAPGLNDAVRAAGFCELVAKFDRPGLIAALKTVAAEWEEAA
jgi:two-component system chemotaxis sensor kinase CheA